MLLICIEIYNELLEILEQQRKEYNRIIETDRLLRKKLYAHYKEFSFLIKETPKRIY